ncbi:binding-protein-dependent transport systems inner membrane component [Beutenbergia cavernae DSM 12333]|uniref:Binding-protein-dependent transport systems inner membrane component n=1 Tax=Beutenbergia cavernae (strain ATCC BAA-8 / DSM 12333 / CCUG 43141 / JCM 11478 / NBRC 16432 / NCIMB 13614 / HKI 0122) TaxID=471853 RepID=C5BZ04_BEUC1|nr:carbohydrate ABC transporter permease [Beutenbergia cavernae]ACQ81119.1 binding-protein-dependent transport systems inner membrane component [Beutenbergia cavernae DSM 12333]
MATASLVLPEVATRRAIRGADNRRATRLLLGSSASARTLAVIALVLMTLVWLLPFAWAIITSFKTEQDAASAATVWPASGWSLQAYTNVLTKGDLPIWMLNSVITAVLVTLITVVVSAMAGYAFSRTMFRGRAFALALTVASIMVPGQILIVPLFQQMLAFQMVDTYAGIILPQVVAPVMVFILKKFFDGIPSELLDAARVDGAGPWRTFFTIAVPLSKSILVAVAIFTFIGAWNNFLWPFIVTTDSALMTIPVGIATVTETYGLQYARTMASAMLAALPLLVVFMLFQRQIVRGVATTGLGGQ